LGNQNVKIKIPSDTNIPKNTSNAMALRLNRFADAQLADSFQIRQRANGARSHVINATNNPKRFVENSPEGKPPP
jgi:hypothetical protein